MNRSRHLVAVALLLASAVVLSPGAVAGPGPMPLGVYLNSAQSVVAGRIVKVESISSRGRTNGDYWRYGRATIAVSEVLKGPRVKTREVDCVTGILPGYGGAFSPTILAVGDSGIWVVIDGSVVGTYGLVPVEQKKDVEKVLKVLAARKWSDPVNGLEAWSAAVPFHGRNDVIIFAVKNVSQNDIFVPSEHTHRFIWVTATAHAEHFEGAVSASGADEMFCRRIKPGQVMYLHPSYFSVDIPSGLPAGDYSVVITCRNNQKNGKTTGPDALLMPVTAWTSELSAPPVELVVSKKS